MEEVKRQQDKELTSLIGVKIEESLSSKFTELCKLNGTTLNEELRRYISAAVEVEKLPSLSPAESSCPDGESDKLKPYIRSTPSGPLGPLIKYVTQELNYWDDDDAEEDSYHAEIITSFLKAFDELVFTFCQSRHVNDGDQESLHALFLDVGGPSSKHFNEFHRPGGKETWDKSAFGRISQLEEFRKDTLSQLANLVTKEALEERLKDYVERYDDDFEYFISAVYELGGSGSSCKDEEGLEEWQQETAFGKISKLEEKVKELEEGVEELESFQTTIVTPVCGERCEFGHFTTAYNDIIDSTRKSEVKIKSLETELAELKALVGNLTKPQESEELPYEQRLIYNSERKYEWNGHAFRSEQEVRVAKALDARNVLFSPNMGCRVDENGTRKTREVDFLVIINGRMGVLECDG